MKICPVCSTEYPDDVKFCPNDGQTLRAAAPANNLVGQVVADRYHVVKKLGEGGMGQVYLAEHVKMGRRSAIKVMNPSMVHDPDAVARFNREASNASRITHPNVCAIYDFGETPDGLIYLAMEFIEGEPLTDLLERDGALPVARATAIFQQTADALQAAHDLGIVHRDLKPDNIMLTKGRGGTDMVKVVDFGIAKAVGGDEAGQKVTKTGLVVGTPEFMSPEQLSGDKLDGRSDLYSLALVYYRMLTGKLPFEATTVQETMIKRLTDEPTKLADARPDLSFPAGLQAVLDTALTRTPAERYQSVSKFAADVATVTGKGGSATAAMPRTRADTEGKTQLIDSSARAAPTTRISAKSAPPPGATSKKRSLVFAGVAVVVVLAGGGAWVALNGGSKASPPPPPPPPPADTTSRVARDTAVNSTTRQNRSVPPPVTPTNHNASNGGSAKARFNLAAAGDALNDLLDSIDVYPTSKVRDSALALFNAPGITSRDKAMAAFVTGNTYFKGGDRTQGCDWVRRASTTDPTTPTYSRFVNEQCN
ncbi:MAG TPA: serine/threonine-protein kinase [Gemmatimonadales bacterium]|nr:serine/threonine-protein kinase [Gemmatimonadales bacterium]